MRTLLVAIGFLCAAAAVADERNHPVPASHSSLLFVTGEADSLRNADRADHWRNGLIGTYVVDLDLRQLSRPAEVNAPVGGEGASAVARHSVEALLPDSDDPILLELTTVYEGMNDVVTHAGTVVGDDGSLVTLSIQGNEILGKIHTNRLLYLLEGSDEAGHTLTVIDTARLPRNRLIHDHAGQPRINVGLSGESSGRASTRPGDVPALRTTGGNVGTLVLYTPAVAARNNISLLASSIIAQTNASLSVSGVASTNYLTMADLEPLSSNLSTIGSRCREELFDDAENRIGAFSDLDSRLANADADMVLILVTTETGYTDCDFGYGRFGGVAFRYDADNPVAFSTDTYALGDLTAPHEIGHVLGGDHESGSFGALSYAYGYAIPSCAWQTMMGGYEDCAFDYGEPDPTEQPVVRLPRWSNPSLSYLGQATGTSTQNMKAALDILMPDVSDWEADPTAPGAGSGFYITSWLCYGTYSANWSSVSGATHYQLMASTSSSFTFPNLVTISGSTSAIFNIAQYETLYLRMRACNAGGCGGYSSQVVADDYYTTCI